MSERKEDFYEAAQALIDMFAERIRACGLGWLIDDPEPTAMPASPDAVAWDEGYNAALSFLVECQELAFGHRDTEPELPVNPYREGS